MPETTSTTDERGVVLVKPGDLLLIGNVGEIDPGVADMLQEVFRTLGIRGVAFAADIDLGLLPGGASHG